MSTTIASFEALPLIGELSSSFGAAIATNLDAEIAFLAPWTVRDLAAHLGGVYAFAEANVRAATNTATPPGDAAAAPDGDAIIEWFATRRSTLIDALTAAPAAQQAWSFAGQQTAGWWQRRMVHETLIHLWDAQVGVGAEPDPIDGDLGTDAINEYIEVSMQHSSSRPERSYPADTLHLHRTDGPGEWMLAQGETEHQVAVTQEHGKGAAAVRASGGDLALWIRGRPVTAIEMFGDEAVAAAWQAVSV